MSKYICLCGNRFKKKFTADCHVESFQDLEIKEGFPRHKIFKQHWQVRLLECLSGRMKQIQIVHFMGLFFIYMVMVIHFNIQLSIFEAGAIGLSLWLIVQ